MTLNEIICPDCGLTYAIAHTNDFFGSGPGYYCTVCYKYWTYEEFAQDYPDYDQSQDHA